jgi:hypothetical protein
MSLDSVYEQKYIKYKIKYLELKKIYDEMNGSGKNSCSFFDNYKLPITKFELSSRADPSARIYLLYIKNKLKQKMIFITTWENLYKVGKIDEDGVNISYNKNGNVTIKFPKKGFNIESKNYDFQKAMWEKEPSEWNFTNFYNFKIVFDKDNKCIS